MDEGERHLLLVLLSLVVLKFGQQLVASLSPVVVFSEGGEAGASARAASERRLFAKGGAPPGSSRLRAVSSLLAAVFCCLPAWWKLTEASPRRTVAGCK